MEHLLLEVFDLPTKSDPKPTASKYAVLPEDGGITITDTSEVFASGDLWSYSFTLNVRANAHIVGSAGEIHGSRLHEQLNKRRARLWVEGEPLYLGYLKLDDEADVDDDGNIDVTFESGQKTFDDLIEGAKANQVPLMSDVMYGVALWRKRKVDVSLRLKAAIVFKNHYVSEIGDVEKLGGENILAFSADGEDDAVQEYPRMVFPKGEFLNLGTDQTETFDFVNTDYPYDEEHPYCNVALCYQRFGYDKKDSSGNVIPDYDGEAEAQRGYEVMPASRVNSAPNFFVIYWMRALMKHLGIHIEENQMTGVEDLRRLFMVNTNCAYRMPKYIRDAERATAGFDRFRFTDTSRRLIPERFAWDEESDEGYKRVVNIEESGFTAENMVVHADKAYPEISHLAVEVSEARPMLARGKTRYEENNCYLHNAFATSECFPDVDISEVISALEGGFGVRLLFSDDYKRVRIVLLRNLFRDQTVQTVACDVVDNAKQENSIRGFRMTYGENSDTTFYYKGFADKLPHKKELWQDNSDTHDYSQWDLKADYQKVIKSVSAFNKICYVTPVNGNAYGVKVDKDAKRYNELHPSLFEYAGYMDAEDGDCTGEENTIETVSVGFTPAIVNDLNWEEEKNSGVREQRFALFVSEEMQPRRPDLNDGTDYNAPDAYYDVDGKLYGKDQDGQYVYGNMMSEDGVIKPGEFAITSDMFAAMKDLRVQVKSFYLGVTTFDVKFDIDGHISEGYRLYLQDNYKPNDDGIAPVETHNWGLTLGIMRGSGSDMGVQYDADPDDLEGNDAWEIVPGSSVTTHPDTCDNYGNYWDYNGQQPGYGDLEDRVSLKLRAEKPNPYYKEGSSDPDKKDRYLEIADENLRGRGLIDRFYKEYSYWVRNARIAKLTVRMELAQLLAIDKTKRVKVGDITGFIRKMQFTVSNKTGLGMVTMEIMYI